MTKYSYDRRASTRFELVYQSGGTGGPYDSEDKAKAAAERLLKGGSDRWIAVIDAKDTTNLTRAKALWLLKRGDDWEKGPRTLPNVRPMDHFKEAAKPDPEDEDPEWLERLGNAADVRKSADDLVSVLEKDPDGELGDLIAAAQAIANNIDDSVETESDFNANTNEALKAVAKLKELLKAAKPMLRKNDLSDSVEIVDEALSDLRGLTKELSELQPES